MKWKLPADLIGAITLKAAMPALRYQMLGTLILYTLPLLGIGSVAALLMIRQYGFLALSIYLVVPMILAPVIYLLYNRKKMTASPLSDRHFKMCLVLYLLLFSSSAALLSAFDVRPIAYYFVVAAIATIVLFEILLFTQNRVRTGVILLQTAALTLNIIWSSSLKYDFFIGRTDIPGHAWLVENLLKYGHVTTIFDVYHAFPLWHIFCAALYMISGSASPVHIIMNIACGLIYAFTIFSVYHTSTKLVSDVRIGLLSSLFTSFYLFFIVQGTEAMSRSITGCLLIVLIFLFMSSKDRKSYPLALLLTLGVIVFHTVSILFFLAILFILYAAGKIFMSKDAFPLLDLKYFVISGAVTIAYWALFADVLKSILINNITTPAPAGIMTQSVIQTPLNEMFNYLQYMPLVLFIILGIVIVLRSANLGQTIKLFSVAALILIPLTFPGPLMLLNKLFANFQVDRFYENGYMFMNLAAAIGFAAIFFKAGRVMKTLLIVTFALLVLLSVSNDFVATDNPLVKRTFYTHYLSAADIAGIDLVAELANNTIMADYPVVRYLNATESALMHMPTTLRIDTRDNTIVPADTNHPLIFHKSELEKRSLDFVAAKTDEDRVYMDFVPDNSLAYFNKSSPAWDSLNRFSKVIDTNSIDVYY